MNLETVLKNCKFALCKDVSRISLCGVFFEYKNDHYTIVATDGHLLYKYSLGKEETMLGFNNLGILDLVPSEQNFIYYGDEKMRTKIQKAGYNVKIFDTDNVYPKYNQVIPSLDNMTPISSVNHYVAFNPERHVQVCKILKSHGEPHQLGIKFVSSKVGPAITQIFDSYNNDSLVLLMPLRMGDA